MNPSSNGWIEKYGSLASKLHLTYPSFESLYKSVKVTGFVYGINVDIPSFITPNHKLSEDEKAKINLVSALYFTFRQNQGTDFNEFLNQIIQFYTDLEMGRTSLFDKLVGGRKNSNLVEKLIESRIYIEDGIIGKTFNNFITNSLLFIDVLLFQQFLQGTKAIKEKAQDLEFLAINIAFHAFSSKEQNRSDEKLGRLLESSLTYIDGKTHHFDGSYRKKLLANTCVAENQYLLDIACLTVWEDQSLAYEESEFIYSIGRDLGFSKDHIAESLADITVFLAEHADQVPFLKDKNMAVQFYDGMAKVANKLILRNSKRLQKELSESAELVALLSKSTLRDLNPEEKKKVYNQLLDIFKSIPSLAIFLLPGGAVLLPVFIKLIPKLLPSSFDENRIDEPMEDIE